MVGRELTRILGRGVAITVTTSACWSRPEPLQP